MNSKRNHPRIGVVGAGHMGRHHVRIVSQAPDVILAGLDNREARVAINQAAARVGRPWIDGAIERLSGRRRRMSLVYDDMLSRKQNDVLLPGA